MGCVRMPSLAPAVLVLLTWAPVPLADASVAGGLRPHVPRMSTSEAAQMHTPTARRWSVVLIPRRIVATRQLQLRGGAEEKAETNTEAFSTGGTGAKQDAEADPGKDEDDPEAVYDEVNLQDLEFDEVEEEYTYPCPCGDEFRISHAQLMRGERIALCPSCSLQLRINASDAVLDAMNKAVMD